MNAAKISASDPYVRDRSIATDKDDRFGHRPLCDELARLVQAVDLPASIALFSPWGTGKSGIAALLATRLRKTSVSYIVFDAWKYAHDPLRRQFMLLVAEELLPRMKSEEVRQQLYAKTQFNRPNIKQLLDRRLWLTALGILIVLGVLAIGGSVIQQLLTSGSKGVDIAAALNSLRDNLVALASLSLVASAALKLAGQLTAVQVTSEPLHDEQLENKFRRIVDQGLRKKKKTRLVVFIDELDRCTSEQAVQVVDTLKSFLEVPRCVYVVAVDRDFLEESLKRAFVKAGFAEKTIDRQVQEHINKVFQHQVPVPPLHPPRLQPFATQLVAAMEGSPPWSQAPADELVAVLIPTHTRSPRRVKTLLNGFAVLHGIARGRLPLDTGEDPAESCLRLAKLSTLRMEFPDFYAELVSYPRLAPYIAELAEHGSCDQEGASKIRGLGEIVSRYCRAQKQLEGDPDAAEETLIAETRLLRYLAKTRNVAMPRHEEIYLESYEAPEGLDRQDAEAALDLARDFQQVGLQRLAETRDQALPVLRYVVNMLDALFGPEHRNAALSALSLLQWLVENKPADLANLKPVAESLSNQILRTFNSLDAMDVNSLPGAVLAFGIAKMPAEVVTLLSDPRLSEDVSAGVLADCLKHAALLCASFPEVATCCSKRMLDLEIGSWAGIAEASPAAFRDLLSAVVLLDRDGVLRRWREALVGVNPEAAEPDSGDEESAPGVPAPGTDLKDEVLSVYSTLADDDSNAATLVAVVAQLDDRALLTAVALQNASVGEQTCIALLAHLPMLEPEFADAFAVILDAIPVTSADSCVNAIKDLVSRDTDDANVRLAQACLALLLRSGTASGTTALVEAVQGAESWERRNRQEVHAVIIEAAGHTPEPQTVIRAEYASFLRHDWTSAPPTVGLLRQVVSEIVAESESDEPGLNQDDFATLAVMAGESTLPPDMRRYWLCLTSQSGASFDALTDSDIASMSTGAASELDTESLDRLSHLHPLPGKVVEIALETLFKEGSPGLGGSSAAIQRLLARADLETVLDVTQRALERAWPLELAGLLPPQDGDEVRIGRLIAAAVRNGEREKARRFALDFSTRLEGTLHLQAVVNALTSRVRRGRRNDLLMACQHYRDINRGPSMDALNGAMRQSAKGHRDLSARVRQLTE